MKTPTLLVILALVALPAAGCIENMRDFKDRVTGAEQQTGEALEELAQGVDETVNATTNATSAETNATRETKPPVARLSVYADGGALLFKASFVGEDQETPIFVKVKDKLTLNGADSEALEPGATLAKYAWTFMGNTLEGRQNVIEMPEEPGLYPLSLTVTDSRGGSDSQSIVLAIAPEPFDVVHEMQTAQFAGADVGAAGVSEPVSVTFDVVHEIDGKMVNTQSATVVAKPGLDCDISLEIFGPDGASIGSADKRWYGSSTQDEVVELGALAVGTYTATVYGFSCAKPSGVPVIATITYIEVVEGIGAGDGHAHNH